MQSVPITTDIVSSNLEQGEETKCISPLLFKLLDKDDSDVFNFLLTSLGCIPFALSFFNTLFRTRLFFLGTSSSFGKSEILTSSMLESYNKYY
jgi:hypothetical protein